MKKYYKITLKDGFEFEARILDKPMFRCLTVDNTSETFLTSIEIKAKNARIVDNEPHYLYTPYVGYTFNEGTLFEIYKNLRNPIIKLEYHENS